MSGGIEEIKTFILNYNCMDSRFIKFSLRAFNHYWLRKIDRHFSTNFSKPLVVLLYLTHACNANCRYCSLPHKKHPNELTTKEWKMVILELRKWLGTFYLNLCGGEPFLRKDIFEIIDFANKIGIITDVTTNGSLFDNEKIKKTINSHLPKIIFSLEGVRKETHDELREKGQFDKIMFAINLLKNKKINITLNTVINRYNLDELPDLVKFAHKNKLNGIKFVEVRVEFIKDEKIREEMWPKDKKKVNLVMDKLIELKREGYPIFNSVENLELIRKYFLKSAPTFKKIYCNLPFDQFCIAANGDVLSCFLANKFFPKNLGNLRLSNPKNIWESEVYVKSRKQRRYCNRNCMMGEGYLSNEGILSGIERFHMAFLRHIKFARAKAFYDEIV